MFMPVLEKLQDRTVEHAAKQQAELDAQTAALEAAEEIPADSPRAIARPAQAELRKAAQAFEDDLAASLPDAAHLNREGLQDRIGRVLERHLPGLEAARAKEREAVATYDLSIEARIMAGRARTRPEPTAETNAAIEFHMGDLAGRSAEELKAAVREAGIARDWSRLEAIRRVVRNSADEVLRAAVGELIASTERAHLTAGECEAEEIASVPWLRNHNKPKPLELRALASLADVVGGELGVRLRVLAGSK